MNRSERLTSIIARREDGASLQQIGDEHGITRERVRQLLAAAHVEPRNIAVEHARVRRLFVAVVRVAELQDHVTRGGILIDTGRSIVKGSAHGTISRYNGGCSCAPCRQANRDHHRALHGRTPPRHGTVHGYRTYGCRCEACTKAAMGSLSKIRNRAYAAVRRAVASGALVRKPCEVCGEKRVQAHHEDYAKPLKVRWLCAMHHRRVHSPGRDLLAQHEAEAA